MTAPRARVARRPVHGVLLLDKPLGCSSNDALQKAKWLLRAEKAGHTGTLDPLATGVLPLCFGAATKFSQLQLDADKSYQAVLQLGVRTSTADAEGEVIAVRPVRVSVADLARVALQFTGLIEQLPPMFSALKKDGKALYQYAREGLVVERSQRALRIDELKLVFADEAQTLLQMNVKCSKGTYVRTLAEDIGEALGCGAHLRALRRLETGSFTLAHCVTLAALEAMPESDRLAQLLPAATLLAGHTPIILDAANAGRFLSGLRRRGAWPDCDQVAVYGPLPGSERLAAGDDQQGVLLGSARSVAGELIPVRLLNPQEIEQMNELRDLTEKVNHEL